MEANLGLTRVVLTQGDITSQVVEAIVNAANSRLAGGGGVDGAIHRAGGPAIMRECDALRAEQGGCPTGHAVRTTAGKLLAQHVFHAVGPVWDPERAEECDRHLASAYHRCLELALLHGARTIAFPSISTGVYGFPIERAAPVALTTVRDFPGGGSIDEVRFVLFSPGDLLVYVAVLKGLAG
jgi:O-acetyl-ADP-ribose deacetylase (regulator of RNase III)